MTNRYAKTGLLLSFIAAVLGYGVHAQTVSLEGFFRKLVDSPSAPPAYENLRKVTGQIEGLRPEEIAKALPSIFAALAYQDETVSAYASSALYSIALRPDSAALLKSHINAIGHSLSTSARPETRAGDIIILGTLKPIPPPEVVPIFLTFLKRTDTDAQAQASGVIFELVQIAPGNPEVIAAVQEFLSRSLDSKSRIDTLNALGNPSVKDARIISMVAASLDDPDPGVRSTAIQALGRIGPQALQQAEPTLQRLAADKNQPTDVTAAAKEALQRIHPPPK